MFKVVEPSTISEEFEPHCATRQEVEKGGERKQKERENCVESLTPMGSKLVKNAGRKGTKRAAWGVKRGGAKGPTIQVRLPKGDGQYYIGTGNIFKKKHEGPY